MQATIHGCDIVWPSPMPTAASRYAARPSSSGHGLERLPREALVGGAQAPRDAAEHLHRDLRMVQEQPADVAGEQGQRARVLGRLDRRRARLAVEHRELAEHLTAPELGERE